LQLSEIQADIQALGYGTDTASQQIKFINDTYREVNGMHRWQFLEAQDSTLVTVSGVNAYSLPAAVAAGRNLDAVRLQIAATQDYLNPEYMPPQRFRDYENIDPDVGTPAFWTYINQQLHFYPTPGDAYTVVIDYVTQPADLVNPTDTPVWPETYHDVLVWGSIRSIAFRERDWLGRQFAQSEFEQRLTRLEDEYSTRQRQSSSHVLKSGHWDSRMPFPFVPIT
jgi:hypothetical protein